MYIPFPHTRSIRFPHFLFSARLCSRRLCCPTAFPPSAHRVSRTKLVSSRHATLKDLSGFPRNVRLEKSMLHFVPQEDHLERTRSNDCANRHAHTQQDSKTMTAGSCPTVDTPPPHAHSDLSNLRPTHWDNSFLSFIPLPVRQTNISLLSFLTRYSPTHTRTQHTFSQRCYYRFSSLSRVSPLVSLCLFEPRKWVICSGIPHLLFLFR